MGTIRPQHEAPLPPLGPLGGVVDSRMAKRITGRQLQRIRRQHFNEHPLCVECKKEGRVEPAVELDHITALVNGGPDFDEDEGENRQGLCERHHKLKTERDLGRRERVTFDADGRVVW